MRVFTKVLTTVVVFGLLLVPSSAKAAAFTIDWTGAFGYTMTGEFSFDDSLLGTGPITGADLTTFSIEGFLNGGSVGTYDYFADELVAPDIFNFNFDSTTLQFLIGGPTSSTTGQTWGGFAAPGQPTSCATTGFAFLSGGNAQGVCVEILVDTVLISAATLRATQVPEPASLALLGMGLVGLGGRAWRRRRAVR